MSKKSPSKIKRLYKIKYLSPKTMCAVINGIDTAEREFREGEKRMAQREEAGKRPLTMKQIKAHMRLCSR